MGGTGLVTEEGSSSPMAGVVVSSSLTVGIEPVSKESSYSLVAG